MGMKQTEPGYRPHRMTLLPRAWFAYSFMPEDWHEHWRAAAKRVLGE